MQELLSSFAAASSRFKLFILPILAFALAPSLLLAQTSDPCIVPSVTVLTDPTGDQVGAPAANQAFDIQSIAIGQSYKTPSSQLVVTMKVASLSSLPPNGIWRTFFTSPDNGRYFVNMSTDTQSRVSFNFGFVDPSTGVNTTVGPADAGTFSSANGTITILISTSNVGGPGAGQQITAIAGRTQVLVGALQTGVLLTIDTADTNPAGQANYTLVAQSSACTPVPLVPPAMVASGLPPRYQNHTPTADQIAQGVGRNSQNEPSIGVNWNTGKVFYIALLKTLRVAFNDLFCPTTPDSLWEDKSFALTSAQTFDPILFTDSQTGRTFVSQNDVAFNSLMAFTDNDGESWVPSQGSGIASGFDHQTVGGGAFHAPLTTGVGYQHTVYYCSQNVGDANCAVSLDGGLTFGPAVVLYNALDCEGLHGHVKVGPDGTAYVPNRGCGGGLLNPTIQAVVVSENNGATWEIRPVPNSLPSGSDPSVAIDKNGRVYFGFSLADHAAAVAVSDDRGKSWTNLFDVGAQAGIKSVAFPAIVAGDKGRAAMAFYGSTFGGSFGASGDFLTFRGDWHLYVAHTFDGGQSWITVNATPNDALQLGALRLGGGGAIHRNLLDFFDATADAQGRVLVGYADGCRGVCNQTSATANGNSYGAYAVIARQSGGRRMFAQFDPPEPTIPGAPKLTVTRNGSLATLTWSQSDNGGSPITNYNIFRSTPGGTEMLLATLGGTTSQFIDQSGDPRVTYAYRVVATNALGQSCGNNGVVAPPVGSSCIPPGITVVRGLTDGQVGAPANAAFNIQSISIGEPFFTDGSQKLVFTMKVATLSSVPPDGQWRILWNFPNRPAANVSFEGRYYAGMNSDSSGNVSFEFGTAINRAPALVNSLSPIRIGAADSESRFTPDGTITVVLSTSKIGNPQPGDLIGALVGRTFQGTAGATLRAEDAIDKVAFADTYKLVGNAFCQNPPPTINCFEDDDPHIAYANGWHLVNDANASAGHFRMNTGRDSSHGMSFTFQVSDGATGALVYNYAKSTKGGTADAYIDGVFKGTISYQGNTGSMFDPQFGFSARYPGLASGQHIFELRNLQGVAYVDQFCLENAFSSAQPTSGPGATTSSTQTVNVAQTLLQNLNIPAGAQAISVVAEVSGEVPIQLVLLDTTGNVVQTANSSAGLAVIELPITQSGLYLVKVVNAGLGPVQVTTLATPLVAR